LSRLGFFANLLSQPISTGYLIGAAPIVIVGEFQKLFGYSSEVPEWSAFWYILAGSNQSTLRGKTGYYLRVI
jgi:MFS superfamily sulfate permease-like transporter